MGPNFLETMLMDKRMDKASLDGPMGTAMRVTLKKMNNMAWGHIPTAMDVNTKAIGIMEESMVKES